MLLANNISFQRNKENIFNNISISLSPKKIIQLSGKNGSGKTTLIKILTFILSPSKGEIFWNGKNIKKNIFDFYNETTLIMDENSSTKSLTMNDNINFWKGLTSCKLSNDEILLLLATFNIEQYINTQVMYLSSGERKKLELIRLIIEQKKLWILDEPYNHLDEKSISILNQTFLDHAKRGGIVLFTSHFESSIDNLEIINFN